MNEAWLEARFSAFSMDRIKGVLGGKKKGAAKATPSGGAAGGAPKPAAVAVPLELPPVEADPLK